LPPDNGCRSAGFAQKNEQIACQLARNKPTGKIVETHFSAGMVQPKLSLSTGVGLAVSVGFLFCLHQGHSNPSGKQKAQGRRQLALL
jgi:hypothetical protein